MANIVFAWEVGEAGGHIGPFQPIGNALVDHGHQLFLVVKDLSRARSFFPRRDVRLLQAPTRIARPSDPIRACASFAQLLHNVGFSDVRELEGLLEAWRPIVSYCRPDLIVGDFAPVASLVAYAQKIPFVGVGSGYSMPPARHPLPMMIPVTEEKQQAAEADELRVTENIKMALQAVGLGTIDTLGGVFAEARANLLMTHPEFDHYQDADRSAFYGVWKGNGRDELRWTTGSSRRAFAYLKPFPNIDQLLQRLTRWEVETKVLAHGIFADHRRKMRSELVDFVKHPIDLDAAAEEIDFAVTNGNHATTLGFLQRGVPVLACPLHLEQRITGKNLQRHELGDWIDSSKPETFGDKLGPFIVDSPLKANAEAFRRRCGEISEREQIERCVEAILAALQP